MPRESTSNNPAIGSIRTTLMHPIAADSYLRAFIHYISSPNEDRGRALNEILDRIEQRGAGFVTGVGNALNTAREHYERRSSDEIVDKALKYYRKILLS